MKKIEVGGYELKFTYPNRDDEINNQLSEIYHDEQYKEAKIKDAVILDVGANIGLASLYFQPVAKMIYALEPNPTLFEALKENTDKFDNIKVFNLGLSYRKHKDYLFTDGDGVNDIPQTYFPGRNVHHRELTDLVGINDFLKDNGIKHVDVMKLDIEGSEYVVLPSKQFKLASKKIDKIVGEAHHTSHGGFPEVIPEILNDYGYKTRFLPFDNFKRTFTYTGDGKDQNYHHVFNTMFVAERSEEK